MADSSPKPPSTDPSNRSKSSFSKSIASTATSSGVQLPPSLSSSSTARTNHLGDSDRIIPDPSKKPFTDDSYRSRFADEGSLPKGYKRPVKRRSIFIEELDAADLDPTALSHLPPPPTSISTSGSTRSRHTTTSTTANSNNTAAAADSRTRTPNSTNNISSIPLNSHIYAINPSKSKESYIMQIPLQPFRLSVLVLILVAFTTISLSVSAEGDLDGLLKRVPGEEGIVERREGTHTPTTHRLKSRILTLHQQY
ncbi:hypothetical protein TWF694_011187 [Orbilia ellipsospora]|uniref:Uncharacterized protein n=1 Tax=Orbilia ellipsospora TaxID=2528407 RepID=A0AAV9X8B9_9PEZI